MQTFCRKNGSTTVITTPEGCHDTLAQETASFGDWLGFEPPEKFAARIWLCASEEIQAGGSWRRPDAAIATKPVRACAAVGLA